MDRVNERIVYLLPAEKEMESATKCALSDPEWIFDLPMQLSVNRIEAEKSGMGVNERCTSFTTLSTFHPPKSDYFLIMDDSRKDTVTKIFFSPDVLGLSIHG